MKRSYKRPQDITAQDIRRWERLYQEFIVSDQYAKVALPAIFHKVVPDWEEPDERENFYAGSWLEDKLVALNADRQDIKDACMALGQKMVFCEDPYEQAAKDLEAFKSGEWDRPGSELAQRLLDEYLQKETGKRLPPPKGKILEIFYQLNTSGITVGEKGGIRIPNAVIVDGEGGLNIAAMAMMGPNIAQDTYKAIYKLCSECNAQEFVFGLDRYTAEGQGTTRKSLLSVHYWSILTKKWKFGIIEYDNDDKIEVDPIRWDNQFWIGRLSDETRHAFQKVPALCQVDTWPIPPRLEKHPELEDFDAAREALTERGPDAAYRMLVGRGFDDNEARNIVKTLQLVDEANEQ